MNRILNFVIIVILSIILRINNTSAMIASFCCGISFIVFGILFLNNKGAGIFSFMYNKPKDILEKYYDRKALFSFEGLLCIILSFGFFVVIAGVYFDITWLMLSVVAYWVLVYAGFIIYSKNGKRFRK